MELWEFMDEHKDDPFLSYDDEIKYYNILSEEALKLGDVRAAEQYKSVAKNFEIQKAGDKEFLETLEKYAKME